jgi:hypothetical protein
MHNGENSISEEVVGLDYHFLPAERLEAVTEVLRALQEDFRLEFMLAVFDVTINERRVSSTMPPSRTFLRKLLQALDEEDGAAMLYTSPYNELGMERGREREARVEWWDFDLADRLCQFDELRSIRAFLEHGTGATRGRPAGEAQRLHDRLRYGLVGDAPEVGIWGCSDIRTPDAGLRSSCGSGEGMWPATEVSSWFHGVFWDDLVFVLNPAESTLSVLAITSE